MRDAHLERLIVAGTDTGIGKTVLSALLTLALDGCYWKPVQSGLEEETDSEAVSRMTRLDAERILPEAYRLERPLSPDQSARIDGVTIDLARLAPPRVERTLVIEGAGGLLVPLSDDLLQIDFFASLGAPLVLAARSGLGTLNHTLLSLEASRARGIEVMGIVMIGPEHRLNIGSLERWAGAPVIGMIPPLEAIDRDALLDVYRTSFTQLYHPREHEDMRDSDE
jgi:dethiobiotin synthetase